MGLKCGLTYHRLHHRRCTLHYIGEFASFLFQLKTKPLFKPVEQKFELSTTFRSQDIQA